MNNHDEDYFVKRPVTPTEEKQADKKTTDIQPDTIRDKKSVKRIFPNNKKTSGNTLELSQSTKQSAVAEIPVADKHKFFKIPDTMKAGSVDMVFLVLLILLLAFGAVMSFSASYAYASKKYGDSYYYLERQLLFMFLGFIAILIVTMFPLKTYQMVTYIVFGVAIILLLLVLIKGVERGGAKRWLQIPGFGVFQPSELGKTALVMALAMYMAKFADYVQAPGIKKSFLYGMIFPALFIGLIGGLVVLEKHFSGLIIICCIGLSVMVLGGTKLRYIVPIGLVAAAGIAVLILFTDYSSSRIEVWLDPWSEPRGSGWQTIQGLYTIASGGIFGVGLGNSRQKYGYVSEPQNDFIFTIVCEALGFIGALAVIVLFFLLIWRGFHIARHSPNRFTYLIVMGLMIKIAFQVGFNIAVVTNSIPNTGISLPFFSSGGTSLLVQMAEMGIVLSISRYAHIKK